MKCLRRHMYTLMEERAAPEEQVVRAVKVVVHLVQDVIVCPDIMAQER